MDPADETAPFRGVVGVDYRLESLSEVLANAMSTQTQGTTAWCFIAATSGELTGHILGNSSNTTSDTAMMTAAARILSHNGWSAMSFNGSVETGEEQQRFEATATAYHSQQARGLDWLIVAGQRVDCPAGQVWRFGRCSACSSGTQSNINTDTCEPCAARQAGSDGTCALCRE